MVLQAAYEATLTIASCLAAKKGARVKVGCLRSLTSERSSLHEKCDGTNVLPKTITKSLHVQNRCSHLNSAYFIVFGEDAFLVGRFS